MKKKIIIGALYSLLSSPTPYFPVMSQKSRVRTKKAMSEEIKSSILASGTLIYKDQIELRSEVIGQVSELLSKKVIQ